MPAKSDSADAPPRQGLPVAELEHVARPQPTPRLPAVS